MPQGKGTYGNKVGRPAKSNYTEKNYKPHMMYCKNGSSKKAKTYKEHLALKKKGCGHKNPKGTDSAMKMEKDY